MTPLWGASTTDESQPKYLTTVEKRYCYADERGWVYQDPYTGLEEVLVCIGGLVTSLGSATIAQVFVPVRNNYGSGFSLNVVFNEAVQVTGAPVIELGGSYTGTGNCVYTAGNNTSELQFTYTPVAGDNQPQISIPDEITLDTGMNVVTFANLFATAAVNMESSGADNTTNVKPSMATHYIINTVPIPLSMAVLDHSNVAADFSVNVTFSNAVTVTTTGGTPYIQLGSNGGAEAFVGDGKANYAGGNLTTTLQFTYPVVSTDSINTGYMTYNNHSIVLNSGYINAAAQANIQATINLETAAWGQTTNILASLASHSIIKT